MLALLLGAAAPAWGAPDPGADELAAYVRARAAAANGAVDMAAQGYGAALTAVPGSEVVAVRAYRQALAAGDLELAGRAAGVLARSNVAPADVAVIDAARAIAGGDAMALGAAVNTIDAGPLDFLAPVLKAWRAVEAGGDDPVAMIDVVGGSALSRRYAAEHRALLLIAVGRESEGIAAVRALLGSDAGNLDLRRAAAELLAAHGRGDTAKALLGGRDPMIRAAKAQIGATATPGTTRWAAERLFTRVAADLSRDNLQPLQISMLRAALTLDGGDGRALLLLADALARDGATARALATIEQAAAIPAYADAAKPARVALLAGAGNPDRALAAARTLTEGADATADDWRRYGDLLIGAGKSADAAAAYGEAIARAGEAPPWTLFLQRGGALEQAGRWGEALPDLKRAVALAPDEPHALNSLGYAQVERGEDLIAARALLERAARLQPEDSAIADSLGWAYIRMGAPAKALPLLEKAARGEPGDVTINEHLGDAYWRLGRRYEARYAWRAAAVHADAPAAARLALKLTGGSTPGL